LKKDILVSAIVSVYNSEIFIKGLFEDLINQTLFEKGMMEIVVVNSGSTENEEPIIQEYISKHENITYLKTENRESIYQAWNRGIKASAGKYITNANTDDRHREDALEIMANHLENDISIDIIYANSLKTDKPNDTFYSTTPKTGMAWIDFDPDLILFGCYLGPHPMWKKELHEKYGYFDENLKVVGDYEYWLRVAGKVKFFHLNEFLGLYYYYDGSAEHRDNSLTSRENEAVQNFYVNRNVKNKADLSRIREKVDFVSKKIGNEQYRQMAFALLNYRKEELLKQNQIYTNLLTKNNIEFHSGNMLNPGVYLNILEDLSKERKISLGEEFIKLKYFVFSDKHEIFIEEFNNLLGKIRAGENMGEGSSDLQKEINDHLDAGLAELEAHSYEAAKKHFATVLEKDENNIDALNNLSVVEAFLQNYENSTLYIEKVFELDETNEIAFHNLKYLDSLLNGNQEEKIEEDTKLLHDAEAFIESGELDEAETILNALISRDAKNLDALNDLSVIHILRGEFEEAAITINKVLTEDTANSTAIENLTTLESLVDEQLKEVRKQMKENNDERN